MANDKLVAFHRMRLDELRRDRSTWEAQWTEAAQRVIPADSNIFQSAGQTGLLVPGQKNTQYMFDATPALACQRFASVIESLSTPQNSRWHFLAAADKTLQANRRVREYFEQVTDILFAERYRPGSNFVANTQQVYLSQGAYGNGIMYVDMPEDRKGLRYRNVHLGETYFVENHARVVDTVYRTFWLTARQAVQLFPKGLPEAIRTAANDAKRCETKYQFLHVVAPRDDYIPGMLGNAGKRFTSCYISVQPEALLSEGGYNSFPYAITRYTQAAGEIYGRGPAQWVLPAIKLLNEQKKTLIKQGHRTVDPILLAHDDGSLDGFTMRAGYLNKGGLSAEGRRLVDVLPVGRVDVGEKMMEMEIKVINDAFLISLFQILVETPQMTATEVLERAREKGMLVAPLAGRMQSEFLGPLIERELEVLAAQGLLPPPPPLLAQSGGQYKIEYDSPMSRMQRAEAAAGFMRTLNTAAEYAKMTQDPSPLDYFNFAEVMPALMDINGVPTRWVATDDQVAAKQQLRTQQAQQAQMGQSAPGLAQLLKVAPDIIKTNPNQ